MTVSIFDLFSIGIGPSSSHTVGPMRAAGRFARSLADDGLLAAHHPGALGAVRVTRRHGHGHGSYNAVLWGLEGEDPETVDTRTGPIRAAEIKRTGRLRLAGTQPIAFDADDDLILHRRRRLPFHPNGMTFTAYAGRRDLAERTYYSIGGGFVLDDDGSGQPTLMPDPDAGAVPVPDRHRAVADLRHDHDLRISDVMLANECARRPEADVRAGLLEIWRVMVGLHRARLRHARACCPAA